MKQGYVIAKNKAANAFFTAASSYDRPNWVQLDESKVYHSIEMAERAVKKICTYGAYEARLVPLAELMDFEMPDGSTIRSGGDTEELPPNGKKKDMVAITQGDDDTEIHQGDEDDDVEADVDDALGIGDNRRAVDVALDAEDKEDDLEGGDVRLGDLGESEQVNELSMNTLSSYANKAGRSIASLRDRDERGDQQAGDKRVLRRKASARAISKVSGVQDSRRAMESVEQLDELSAKTLRSYSDKAVAGWPKTPSAKKPTRMATIAKADALADDKEEIENVKSKFKTNVNEDRDTSNDKEEIDPRVLTRANLERDLKGIDMARTQALNSGDRQRVQELNSQFRELRNQLWDLKESDTMPAKPPLDAKPSENKDTALDLKKPETIKYKNPANVEDGEDTSLNKSGAWEPNAKVKLPANVKSDLTAAIAAFNKTADYSNKVDDARASFAMTVAAAFQDLLNALEQETAEGIKAAQIKMTSWMNPITSHLPVSVQKFVMMGGRKATLQDLFDAKRAEQKE